MDLRDPVIAFVNEEYERRMQMDEKKSTRGLVQEWNRLNCIRTVIMVLGVLAGACAVVLDE